MFGVAGQKRLEKLAITKLRSMPRHARSERLATMRWYRRQYMAHALRKARLELAVWRRLRTVALLALAVAALSLHVIALAHWLHR